MINSVNTKSYFLVIFLCGLFSCTSSSQQEDSNRVLVHEDTLPFTPKAENKVEPQLSEIQQIQEAYSLITSNYNSGKLDSSAFKYNCNGERSGTVTYFTQKGDLKMITHSYAEYDHNEMKDRYFIKDGIPFFAHLWSLSWSFDNGPEGATKDQITERRIYLSDWKAIKCLEKKYEVRLHAGVNPKPTDLPNKEVNCEGLQSIEKNYGSLAKYWKKTAPQCLEK